MICPDIVLSIYEIFWIFIAMEANSFLVLASIGKRR